MTKKRKAIIAISALVVPTLIALTTVFFLTRNYPYYFEEWPEGGKDLAMREMQRYMINHYCTPQMVVIGKTEITDNGYLFRRENEVCKSSYKFSGWKIDNAAVTAFYRCDLGDQLGDYAVTIYRNPEQPGGQSYCDYKYFLKGDDKGELANVSIFPKR